MRHFADGAFSNVSDLCVRWFWVYQQMRM